MNKTSLLPKLLAKENITIQHGNYKTAWFDIKNRILGLPLWDDMHKDIYDLFTGHEVGHALETPFDGWHDSPEKLNGCPRTYINVVEDARIERKIQTRYPGLVGAFNRGYDQLMDRGFFGDLSDINWDQVKLIDKINLKAKLGTKITVPFISEEKVFMDRSMTTETFEEVLELVRDILAWTKENQSELMEKPEPNPSDEGSNTPDENGEGGNEDPTSSGHDDMESDDNEQSDFEKLLEESLKAEETSDAGESEEVSDGDESDDSATAQILSNEPEYKEIEDISITDTIFREQEKSLMDIKNDGTQAVFIDDINKEVREMAIIKYNELKKARQALKDRLKPGTWGHEDAHLSYTQAEFKSHIKTLKKNVQVAVKEFEMRKAAYQYQRATTARTGTIDVNSLWSYKTNDDIFLTSTNLADAKNHGMMLLIDMSGSMSASMPQVMDQVMHLVMFCKAINIPFDVYGFTSNNSRFNHDWQKNHTGVEMNGLSMPHICSSTFSKKDFMDSLEHMFFRIKLGHGWGTLCEHEDWGSTPLNHALIISHHLVKKFKSRHGVEKMNFITFTDGDANRLTRYSVGRDENEIRADRNNCVMKVDGSFIKSSYKHSRDITEDLLNNMAKKYGTNNIGFFIADTNQHWRQRLWILADAKKKYLDSFQKAANKEYRQNKCVSVDNVLGYKEYYLVKGGKSLETQEDEFEVKEDATKANIRSAFKKFAKSKKQNKVLMTKFGKAVA